MKDLKKELQEHGLKVLKALYPLVIIFTISTALTVIFSFMAIPTVFKAWQEMPK